MKNTIDCLVEAIQGESDAVRMYTAFAEKALQESLPNISNLFLMLAEAEKIHIRNHKSALDGKQEVSDNDEKLTLGDTLANLKTAYEGELYENKKMYPGFFKKIKKDFPDNYAKVAFLSMEWASKAEAEHAKHLARALKCVENGKDLPDSDFYLCRVCGNIEIGKPEKECDICGHDQLFFINVDTALKHQQREV